MVLAQKLAEAVVLEHAVDIGRDAREHDVRAFAVAHFAEVVQVVDARGINERHAAHADDAHLGMIVEGGHEFLKLVGNAEEVRAVDLVHLHTLGNDEVLFVHFGIGFVVGVDLVGNHLDLGGLGHAAHEEEAGDEQAHFDGDGEVEDDGEEEGDEQHDDVALGVLHQLHEGAPSAHVVAHDDQHAGQARHGDEGSQRHEHEEDDEQYGSMDDAGHGGASAVVDVGHRTGNGSRARDAAEERGAEVGHALADEFLVGVVVVAAYTVGHGGRKERLNGTEHGNHHGGGEESLEVFPSDVGHGELGNAGLDLAKLVADGGDVHVGVGIEEIHTHRHHDDGHE